MLIKTNEYHYEWFNDNGSDQALGSFDLFANESRKKPLSLWSFGIKDSRNRNMGFGQKMLKEAIVAADGNDIELYVYKTNLPAIHIYEKYGFCVVGQNSDFVLRMVRYHDLETREMVKATSNESSVAVH